MEEKIVFQAVVLRVRRLESGFQRLTLECKLAPEDVALMELLKGEAVELVVSEAVPAAVLPIEEAQADPASSYSEDDDEEVPDKDE